jgi:hypothetical protein
MGQQQPICLDRAMSTSPPNANIPPSLPLRHHSASLRGDRLFWRGDITAPFLALDALRIC